MSPTIRYLLLFSVLLSACATPARRQEPDNLVWPLPPDLPRIKYIQSIYSEDDVGREYSFMESLFGKAYVDDLSRPYGVIARRGKISVADLNWKMILVFDLEAKSLSVLGREGVLRAPASAVVDAVGTMYVADAGGSKIALYNAQGNYVTAYPLKGVKPVALAINELLGRLYVVDREGHRVIVLGLDGKQLFEFGGRGAAKGQFNMPLSIALDKRGDVHVLDSGNFRVQLFDADGKFISAFGEVGDQSGMFANPKGIAVDSDGNIYVTDAAFNNVQVFDRKGRFLLFFGNMGPYPGQMRLPSGISIDENDRIYIADQLNKRIQVFQYLKSR